MGDFILYKKDRLDQGQIDQACTTLLRQAGLKETTKPHAAIYDSYGILFFDKSLSPLPNFIQEDTGDFCASSGSLIYKGLMGEEALRCLLKDYDPDQYCPEDYAGIFTVILGKKGRLFLITDPLGASRVFHSLREDFWSSSFLATCGMAKTLTPCPQALYEYAFQETTYGQDTPFKEIKTAHSQMLYEFTGGRGFQHRKNLHFDFADSLQAYDDLVQEVADLLRAQVAPLIQRFGSRIKTALSGGYDSRLMLALLKDAGTDPGVYVYGSDSSPDVQVAKNIATGEGFDLDHIDKGHFPTPTPGQYKEIVKDNFYALDGYPGEGIFDFGANMATRRGRAANNSLILNGGGGEIFRNFFYLPDGPYKVHDLINSFYNRYTRDFCQDYFCEKTYRQTLAQKIRQALDLDNDSLSRTQVEYAYPAFRLRYWTSRDNSNNTRLGSYVTPFISYSLIKKALTIPLKYKNHGQFQADLIQHISPELARYPSDYGYCFDKPVPLKAKLKNHLTLLRPAWLRRYSYALQHKMKTLSLPKTLSPDYVDAILCTDLPRMSAYFKIDQIKDCGLLARLYTLEVLFDHFSEKIN